MARNIIKNCNQDRIDRGVDGHGVHRFVIERWIKKGLRSMGG